MDYDTVSWYVASVVKPPLVPLKWITCGPGLSGKTATFAGTVQPNSFGFTFQRTTAVDNGPPHSGLDTLAVNGYFAPVDCSTPEPGFFGPEPLTSGDIVVVDAP